MPEIRIGAGANMEDIRIGTTQIEEVRLGTELVWRNNEAPIFSATTFGGNAIIAGAAVATRRNTATTVGFSLTEVEGDVPYTVTATINGTAIADTATVATAGGNGTLNITAAELGGTTAPAGVLDTPIRVEVTATDSANASSTFVFTIRELTVAVPTIQTTPAGNQVLTSTGAAQTATWSYTYITPVSGQGLTISAPGPDITATAGCGGTDTATTQAPVITSIIAGGTLAPVNGLAVTRTLTVNGINTVTATANVEAAVGANFTVAPTTVSTNYTGQCGNSPVGFNASGNVTLTANAGFSFAGNATFNYAVPNTVHGGTHTVPANTGNIGADVDSTVTLVDNSAGFRFVTASPIIRTGPAVATFDLPLEVAVDAAGEFVVTNPTVEGVEVPFAANAADGATAMVTIPNLSFGQDHTITLTGGDTGSATSVFTFTDNSGAFNFANTNVSITGPIGAAIPNTMVANVVIETAGNTFTATDTQPTLTASAGTLTFANFNAGDTTVAASIVGINYGTNVTFTLDGGTTTTPGCMGSVTATFSQRVDRGGLDSECRYDVASDTGFWCVFPGGTAGQTCPNLMTSPTADAIFYTPRNIVTAAPAQNSVFPANAAGLLCSGTGAQVSFNGGSVDTTINNTNCGTGTFNIAP